MVLVQVYDHPLSSLVCINELFLYVSIWDLMRKSLFSVHSALYRSYSKELLKDPLHTGYESPFTKKKLFEVNPRFEFQSVLTFTISLTL